LKIIRPLQVVDSVLTSSNVGESDYSAYSTSTVYSTGTIVQQVSTNVHKVYESLTGSTSVVTMTIASPCVVTWTAHGLAANTPISFTTTGTLPTGLVASTVYYVSAPTTDTFNVSATIGGAAINTSGSQSGTITAIGSANYNKPVTNTTYWLDRGNTNRWRMFDSSVTSQTSNTTSIALQFAAVGRIDSVALLNVSAATAQITMTDATDGVVYNKTITLTSDGGITDWYAWFFDPIERTSDLVVTDMPPYANATINVTLTDTGNTVLCGACVLGQVKEVGDVEVGVRTGIQDYSVKTQDSFGNYTILERAFRKTLNFTLWIDPADVDPLQKLLATYRATPIIYIASDDYQSAIVYGFYKDFSIDIAYTNKSVCTLSLEGLA